MKCPKYIEKLLKQRADAASKFLDCDYQISVWLEKRDLDFKVEEYDIRTGCESLINPYDSSARILEVIKNA